jgi:MOSC domain-containing protein YiiM
LNGRIVQVSISRGGIPKLPVGQALATRFGLEGDSWTHPQFHGGPRQALLLIAQESLDELAVKGYALFPGALGENLTTAGIDRRQMRAGQRYRVGEAFIELTKLRSPCRTLDAYPGIQKEIYDKDVKAGDASSPRWALGGFYAAVLRPGVIRQQDIISLVDQVV